MLGWAAQFNPLLAVYVTAILFGSVGVVGVKALKPTDVEQVAGVTVVLQVKNSIGVLFALKAKTPPTTLRARMAVRAIFAFFITKVAFVEQKAKLWWK